MNRKEKKLVSNIMKKMKKMAVEVETTSPEQLLNEKYTNLWSASLSDRFDSILKRRIQSDFEVYKNRETGFIFRAVDEIKEAFKVSQIVNIVCPEYLKNKDLIDLIIKSSLMDLNTNRSRPPTSADMENKFSVAKNNIIADLDFRELITAMRTAPQPESLASSFLQPYVYGDNIYSVKNPENMLRDVASLWSRMRENFEEEYQNRVEAMINPSGVLWSRSKFKNPPHNKATKPSAEIIEQYAGINTLVPVVMPNEIIENQSLFLDYDDNPLSYLWLTKTIETQDGGKRPVSEIESEASRRINSLISSSLRGIRSGEGSQITNNSLINSGVEIYEKLISDISNFFSWSQTPLDVGLFTSSRAALDSLVDNPFCDYLIDRFINKCFPKVVQEDQSGVMAISDIRESVMALINNRASSGDVLDSLIDHLSDYYMQNPNLSLSTTGEISTFLSNNNLQEVLRYGGDDLSSEEALDYIHDELESAINERGARIDSPVPLQNDYSLISPDFGNSEKNSVFLGRLFENRTVLKICSDIYDKALVQNKSHEQAKKMAWDTIIRSLIAYLKDLFEQGDDIMGDFKLHGKDKGDLKGMEHYRISYPISDFELPENVLNSLTSNLRSVDVLVVVPKSAQQGQEGETQEANYFTQTLGISRRNNKYFVSSPSLEHDEVMGDVFVFFLTDSQSKFLKLKTDKKQIYDIAYGDMSHTMMKHHKINGVSLKTSIYPSWVPEKNDFREFSFDNSTINSEIGHPNNQRGLQVKLEKLMNIRGEIVYRRDRYRARSKFDTALKEIDKQINSLKWVLYIAGSVRYRETEDKEVYFTESDGRIARGSRDSCRRNKQQLVEDSEILEEMSKRLKEKGYSLPFVNELVNLKQMEGYLEEDEIEVLKRTRAAVTAKMNNRKNVLIFTNVDYGLKDDSNNSNNILEVVSNPSGQTGNNEDKGRLKMHWGNTSSTIMNKITGSDKSNFIIIPSSYPLPSGGLESNIAVVRVDPNIITVSEMKNICDYILSEIKTKNLGNWSREELEVVRGFDFPMSFYDILENLFSSLNFDKVYDIFKDTFIKYISAYLETKDIYSVIDMYKFDLMEHVDSLTKNDERLSRLRIETKSVHTGPDSYITKKDSKWSKYYRNHILTLHSKLIDSKIWCDILYKCIDSSIYFGKVESGKFRYSLSSDDSLSWIISDKSVMSAQSSIASMLGSIEPIGVIIENTVNSQDVENYNQIRGIFKREIEDHKTKLLNAKRNVHPLIILHGTGGTGKSIFGEVMAEILECGLLMCKLGDTLYSGGSGIRGGVEKNLMDFLDLCKNLYKKILLVDEVDGFFLRATSINAGPEVADARTSFKTAWEDNSADMKAYKQNELFLVLTTNEYEKLLALDSAMFKSRMEPFEVQSPSSVEDIVDLFRGDAIVNAILDTTVPEGDPTLFQVARSILNVYLGKGKMDKRKKDYLIKMILAKHPDFFSSGHLQPAAAKRKFCAKNSLNYIGDFLKAEFANEDALNINEEVPFGIITQVVGFISNCINKEITLNRENMSITLGSTSIKDLKTLKKVLRKNNILVKNNTENIEGGIVLFIDSENVRYQKELTPVQDWLEGWGMVRDSLDELDEEVILEDGTSYKPLDLIAKKLSRNFAIQGANKNYANYNLRTLAREMKGLFALHNDFLAGEKNAISFSANSLLLQIDSFSYEFSQPIPIPLTQEFMQNTKLDMNDLRNPDFVRRYNEIIARTQDGKTCDIKALVSSQVLNPEALKTVEDVIYSNSAKSTMINSTINDPERLLKRVVYSSTTLVGKMKKTIDSISNEMRGVTMKPAKKDNVNVLINLYNKIVNQLSKDGVDTESSIRTYIMCLSKIKKWAKMVDSKNELIAGRQGGITINEDFRQLISYMKDINDYTDYRVVLKNTNVNLMESHERANREQVAKLERIVNDQGELSVEFLAEYKSMFGHEVPEDSELYQLIIEGVEPEVSSMLLELSVGAEKIDLSIVDEKAKQWLKDKLESGEIHEDELERAVNLVNELLEIKDHKPIEEFENIKAISVYVDENKDSIADDTRGELSDSVDLGGYEGEGGADVRLPEQEKIPEKASDILEDVLEPGLTPTQDEESEQLVIEENEDEEDESKEGTTQSSTDYFYNYLKKANVIKSRKANVKDSKKVTSQATPIPQNIKVNKNSFSADKTYDAIALYRKKKYGFMEKNNLPLIIENDKFLTIKFFRPLK